ncbi:MAG: isoprenylcysteine carboxylmethyltransferase family protein [Parvularculaceae bacterium]|nr:isoprenylcysteine carboxylmethyltransferase family protein [Parvularculaceae bacterium]
MNARGSAPPVTKGRPVVPPPLLALAAGVLMWIIARKAGLPALDFPGRVPLAAALAGAGLLIDLVSVAAFLRARTTVNPLAPDKTNALVVTGLYRVSRNPMYLGMALVLAGWAVWLGQALTLVPVAAFVALIEVIQIRPEEKALEEKFGEDYRAYKKRVRRWI